MSCPLPPWYLLSVLATTPKSFLLCKHTYWPRVSSRHHPGTWVQVQPDPLDPQGLMGGGHLCTLSVSDYGMASWERLVPKER